MTNSNNIKKRNNYMWLFSKLTPLEEWKLACYFNPSLRHARNRENMQPIGWRGITATPSSPAPGTEDMPCNI